MSDSVLFNTYRETEEEAKQARELELQQAQEAPPVPEQDENAPKDVKDYNLGDNLREAGNAVVGAGVDLYNSVGSLPQFFDKEFYKPNDPENPYKYEAPWLINNKPITRTVWGNFLRSGLELTAGMVGTGKIMWGMKGLKGIASVAGASRKGRLIMGAAQGGVYDVISNQSREANLAASLLEIKPQWSGILSPIATTENMSPAMKSAYNVGDGLGIGAMLDITFEAAGWGVRSYSQTAKKAAKKAKLKNPIIDAIDESAQLDYSLKDTFVDDGAKKNYKGKKAWSKLTNKEKDALKEVFAEENDIDWGPTRNLTSQNVKRGDANLDLGMEQLEFDLSTANGRQNPAYTKGGDFTDNQALPSSTNPAEGARDMIQIRNDPTQKYGSPRGTLTEANIRRVEYTAPGMMLNEIKSLGKKYDDSAAYKVLYNSNGKYIANKEVIQKDFTEATADLGKFLNDNGHSRLIDIPQEDIVGYIKNKEAGRPTVIEGIGTLNKSQLVAADTILGQLLYEARDLAKAGLSVQDHIDLSAPGSLLDGILSRYAAVARMRKETSALASFELKKFQSGGKLQDTISEADIRGKASDQAANEIASFKQLIRSDLDDELLETFLHFTATSNGNKQSWKDFTAFMKRKIHGYKDGDVYQRNVIINEMMNMGVNSMLSGPKTPVRALVGTGIGTVMRPVATILGSLGKGDDQVLRGAYAHIGGMMEARNDAWRKAVAEFQSYNMHEEGWRGFTSSKADVEWESMKQYANEFGTVGEKAEVHFADMLRGINKSPYLNYGPRIMKSIDAGFSTMIGRGRMRQLAYDDVYTNLKNKNGVVSDQDLERLVQAAEIDFENKVFTADGQLSDEMAKFAADEAKLTSELTGFAKDLDKAFDQTPYLRPFFLFARTGVNALKMTSKYTPILNNFIKEHVDISTRTVGDPELLKYGIKTAHDLDIAKSTMRGRMAIGYGFTGMAAWMAANGKITGNGPPDRQLRNSWMQMGWQPRSWQIGNSYVSFEALEPFNMFFSLASDIADSQKVMGDEWAGNWFGKMSYLISANVTNKSFLAGLLQLQDLLTSQGGDAERVAANFVNNQIPLGGLRNEIGKVLSPGMRELESGFWQSVGNRNLYADILQPGEVLPYRYDWLDGSKLKDYQPLTRLVNGVLPINLNIGSTSPTRELLFRSGINFKQVFNTGPNGEKLEGYPDLKSKWQFYMGQQNLEGRLTDLLSEQMIDSIKRMEADRDAGRSYEPRNTLHGKYIFPVIRNAKKEAWQMLLSDKQLGGKAQTLVRLHNLNMLGDRMRVQGDYTNEADIAEEVKKLKNLPVK